VSARRKPPAASTAARKAASAGVGRPDQLPEKARINPPRARKGSGRVWPAVRGEIRRPLAPRDLCSFSPMTSESILDECAGIARRGGLQRDLPRGAWTRRSPEARQRMHDAPGEVLQAQFTTPNATDILARLPRPVHSESSTTCRRARERTEAFQGGCAMKPARANVAPPESKMPPAWFAPCRWAGDLKNHHRRRAHHSHYSYCPSPNRKRPGTPPGRFALLVCPEPHTQSSASYAAAKITKSASST